MPRVNSQTSYWGKYLPPTAAVISISAFELKCQELKLLSFEDQKESTELHTWVLANFRKKYVPEKLLKVWELHYDYYFEV